MCSHRETLQHLIEGTAQVVEVPGGSAHWAIFRTAEVRQEVTKVRSSAQLAEGLVRWQGVFPDRLVYRGQTVFSGDSNREIQMCQQIMMMLLH